MHKILLILIAVSTVASFSVARAGDVRLLDDVTVPIPNDLAQPGSLQVKGVAGPGQSKSVRAVRCNIDSQGAPLSNGCVGRIFNFELNQKIILRAGLYKIIYSHTLAWVIVESRQLKQVPLPKIKVPAGPKGRKFSFSVFKDFTDPSMQDSVLFDAWTGPQDNKYLDITCDSRYSDLKVACDALKSNDHRRLLGTVVKFGTDGSLSVLFAQEPGGGVWSRAVRTWVTDPEAGQFVSAFPGVYGIVFKDEGTDETSTLYGIKVN